MDFLANTVVAARTFFLCRVRDEKRKEKANCLAFIGSETELVCESINGVDLKKRETLLLRGRYFQSKAVPFPIFVLLRLRLLLLRVCLNWDESDSLSH